jgi:hypothetical protein
MATSLDVLNVARSQLGFHAGAQDENPYGDWYGIKDAPYCAMGVSWCFAQVGLSHLVAAQTPKGFAYNPAALPWFQRQGLVVNKYQGEPGDLVFYDWNSDGVVDHVEILEAASPDGITTIGFNTGNPNDSIHESGCFRVHRPYLFISAIVRPQYPIPLKATPKGVTGKKATAVVGGTGTAIAGATGAIHGGLLTTTPTATTKATTVFVAPPFPISKTAFNVGQKNDAVMTIEKALAKAGLLPAQYVTGVMNVETEKALTKYEAKQGIKVTGSLPQIIYDELKGTL